MKFFFGLCIGIAAGLLFAPARGEVTRQQIADKAEELRRQGVEKGREQAREIGSEVGERLFDKAIGEERTA
jgi:gas vesicle protein